MSVDSDHTRLLFSFSCVAGCPAFFAKTVFSIGDFGKIFCTIEGSEGELGVYSKPATKAMLPQSSKPWKQIPNPKKQQMPETRSELRTVNPLLVKGFGVK